MFKFKNIFKELKRKKESKNREIARLIGEYYLGKNAGNYKNTEEEIRSLSITQIKNTGNTIIITLQRPGLLIGRRGDNIEALQKFMLYKTNYSKINIEEDKIISWLVPYDYSGYETDWLG